MINEASIVGIINDPRSKPSEDRYQALIDAAEQHGLKVILVGHDHDMDSELTRKIIESERFEVVSQWHNWSRPLRSNCLGGGPRDKWGRLK